VARGISTLIGTLLFLLVASLLLALALRALSELALVFNDVTEYQKELAVENLNLTVDYAAWKTVSASSLNTRVDVIKGSLMGSYTPSLLDSFDNQAVVVTSEPGNALGIFELSLLINMSALGLDFNGTLWVRFNSTVFVKVYRMVGGFNWVLLDEWLAEPDRWLQLVIKNGWYYRLLCYFYQPFSIELDYLDAKVLSPAPVNLTVLNIGTEPVKVYGIWLRSSTWETRTSRNDIVAPGSSIQLGVNSVLLPGETYEVRVVTATRVHRYRFTIPVVTGGSPPQPPSGQPLFRITSYSDTVEGLSGSRAMFAFQVSNEGDADGVARVEIYDHLNKLVNSTALSIPKGSSAEGSLALILPLIRGTYTWNVRVYNSVAGKYDDSKTFTVKVLAPYFSIVNYNTTLYGLPRSTVAFVVRVANNGDADGSAFLEIYDHLGELIATRSLEIPASSSVLEKFGLVLPASTGAYIWSVKVLNNRTGEYDDAKSFNIYVVDISLIIRSAIVYESFESMPTGWASIGGTWTITSNGFIGNCIQGMDDNRGPAGASVYYWQQGELPLSFQVIVKVGGATNNDRVYRGLALLRDSSSTTWFYVIATYPWGSFIDLRLRRYTGTWTTLRSSRANYVTSWYTIYLSFSRTGTSNVFSAMLYDENGNLISSLTYTDTSANAFQPRYLALFVDGSDFSFFDELIMASGDPRIVRVTGLSANWIVELWRGTAQISSAVADDTGTAILDVLQYPIVGEARLVIKDELGNLIVSKDFDKVLGGDTYKFVKP